MPKTTGPSPIPKIAALVALALGCAVAYYMFAGYDSPDLVLAPSGQETVAQAEPEVTPSPTPEPVPEPPEVSAEPEAGGIPERAIPSDAGAAAEAPQPTATPEPTPSPTPIPQRIYIEGFLADADGAPEPQGEIYAVKRTSENLTEAVRTGFAGEATRWTAQADAMGYYELELPADQAYYIGLMIGGEPQPYAREVKASPAGTEISADLNLPTPVEIRGTVSDEENEAAPDIPIRVTWRPRTLLPSQASEQVTETTTAPDGSYSIKLQEPAAISLIVDAEAIPAESPYLFDGKAVRLTEEDYASARIYRADFDVVNGVNIAGKVLAADTAAEPGLAIGNARVQLTRLGEDRDEQGEWEWETTTDASGSFSFSKKFPGSYELRAEYQGYNPGFLRNYETMNGASADIYLHPFGTVTGEVVLRDARTSDTTVMLNLVGQQSTARQETVADGSYPAGFTFVGVKPGHYLLLGEATTPNGTWYGEKAVLVESGQALRIPEFELYKLTQVKGLLADPVDATTFSDLTITAQPVKALDVPVYIDWSGVKERKRPIASTSASGEFTLENVLEGHRYAIKVVDRETRDEVGSAVGIGGREGRIRIVVGGTGTVTGTVTNARGQACEGATVELTANLGSVAEVRGQVEVRRAAVDYNGTYRFESVPVGPARVVLAGDGSSARLITVQKGQTFTLDLECRDFVSMEIQVTDNDPGESFRPREQFLIIPKPGTETLKPLIEATYGELKLELEAGSYTITRTSTMESRSFEVHPLMPGEVSVDFTSQEPEEPQEESEQEGTDTAATEEPAGAGPGIAP